MRESYHEQGKARCLVDAAYILPGVSIPGCPFCYANGKLKVIASYPSDVRPEAATAHLVLAKDSPNGDDYLVIPGNHAVTEDDLPTNFTVACKYLRQFIPWMEEATADPMNKAAASYHDGANHGASSGETVWHEHRWYARTPAGSYVPGIATYTSLEVQCQDALGMSLQEVVDSAITLKTAMATR